MKFLPKYLIGSFFRTSFPVLFVASFLFSTWSPVSAAEDAHKSAVHSFHRHHSALFIGNTQNNGNENGFSIGMDYEYRINQWLGVGGLVEYAAGDFEHVLVAVPVFIHPYRGWRIGVAAGTEIHKDEEKKTRERSWLIRTGVGYQFLFDEKYSISPEFNVDFSDHEMLLVYGVSFGFGF